MCLCLCEREKEWGGTPHSELNKNTCWSLYMADIVLFLPKPTCPVQNKLQSGPDFMLIVKRPVMITTDGIVALICLLTKVYAAFSLHQREKHLKKNKQKKTHTLQCVFLLLLLIVFYPFMWSYSLFFYYFVLKIKGWTVNFDLIFVMPLRHS